MSERAAIYARVSTARQEQDQTIAAQLAILDHTATEFGLVIDPQRRYVDDGISGSRLDRPALDALRDAAADGLLDIVLVVAPDRLSRNFVHQQIVLEELQRRGVRVHFVDHPVGVQPEDRLLVQMQGAIAEYERTKILERTRRGRLHKVRAGQVLPFTIPPYGYAIERTAERPRGVVVIEEVEAMQVRAMCRWVLDEGLSARAVARRLNAQGVPPRHAKYWTGSSVHAVLTNSAHAGSAVFGRREPAEPRRPRHPGAYRKNARSSCRVRPEAQWMTVSIPAIIDVETHRAVRARLVRNGLFAPRNVRHPYLLQSLVVCGDCGRRMSGQRHQSACHRYEYFHYVCTRRDPVDTAFAATLRLGFDRLTFAERQQLVRLLIERVVVTGERVTIEHAVPLTGRFRRLRPHDRAGQQGVQAPHEVHGPRGRRHAPCNARLHRAALGVWLAQDPRHGPESRPPEVR